jgi:hypothetical protein
MSLVNLVQLICLEQQSAALILSKEQSEQGIIYFNQGEIVDANIGPLRGEDAVYEILTWTEGKFRLSSDVLLPRRVIMTPWDQILAEGSRRIDEMRVEGEGLSERDEGLTSSEMAQDDALEVDLIYLLSKLEHSRALLTEVDKEDRPPLPLPIFSNIVKNVVEMTEKHLPGNDLEEALSAADNEKNGTDLIQVKRSLVSDNLLQEGQDLQIDADKALDTHLRLGSSVVEILDRLFDLMVKRFRSSSAADRWRETCAAYLDELRHAIEEYQC